MERYQTISSFTSSMRAPMVVRAAGPLLLNDARFVRRPANKSEARNLRFEVWSP
jgi:hypothetical protein